MEAPAEVEAPAGSQQYWEYRAQDALGAPYRIPRTYFRNIHAEGPLPLPECPLVVFINARSGGRAGPALALALNRAVGRAQVFDLSEYRPDKVLTKLYENLKEAEAGGDKAATVYRERLRILVAGGDGTIAWVLGVIKGMGLKPAPPVAIMPLGTGNDLARTFGWGHAFSKGWINGYNGVYNTLMRITSAKPDDLDCWRLRIKLPTRELLHSLPHSLQVVSSGGGGERVSRLQDAAGASGAAGSSHHHVVAQGLFWNYFSVGLDAKSAHGFHHLREEHPALAAGRLSNQFWYSFFSCTSGWFCCTKPLAAKVKLCVQTPGSDAWQELAIPHSVKALVVLNLQSYAGGRNLWGTAPIEVDRERSGHKLKEPSYNDGLLEVVGLQSGYHTATIMATKGTPVHALRICQAAGVRMELRASYVRPDGNPSHVYLQVDGEPWKQDVPSARDEQPVLVEIAHNGVSKLAHNYLGLGVVKAEKLQPPKQAQLVPPGPRPARGPSGRGSLKPPSPMSPSIAAAMHSGVSMSGVTAVDSEAVHVGSERPSSMSLHSTTLSLVSRSTTAI